MWNCANYGNITSTNSVAGGLVANGDNTKFYNCYNTGKLTGSGTSVFGLGGDSSTPSAINCYSAGVLNTTSTASRTGVLLKSGASLTNCYYLDGIKGTTNITPEVGATAFYNTSDDPEVMTSAKVVAALNSYIESNEDGINTTGWCKWEVSSDNLPVLDFNTEWNGTAWVTVSN